MTFKERKEYRKDYYKRFIEGWKMVRCTACNGSGHYDHDGAPACGACNGTGKCRERTVAS